MAYAFNDWLHTDDSSREGRSYNHFMGRFRESWGLVYHRLTDGIGGVFGGWNATAEYLKCAGACIGGEIETLGSDSFTIKSGFGLEADWGVGIEKNFMSWGANQPANSWAAFDYGGAQLGPLGIDMEYYGFTANGIPQNSSALSLSITYPGGLGIHGGTGLKYNGD
jgi:hypothetical protein